MRTTLALGIAILFAASARSVTIYRVELATGGVVFAEERPIVKGPNLVFRTSPQGIYVSLRRGEVSRIERIESDDRPSVDLGRAKLKQQGVTLKPAWERDGSSVLPAGDRDEPIRRYVVSDDIPGRAVAFPASADDLLPGNYRPFPAARGGQNAPLPMIREGVGTPKAGSLREPPKAIGLAEAPNSANPKVPAPALAFSEQPRVEVDRAPTPSPR